MQITGNGCFEKLGVVIRQTPGSPLFQPTNLADYRRIVNRARHAYAMMTYLVQCFYTR